jgi:hypothetical protein
MLKKLKYNFQQQSKLWKGIMAASIVLFMSALVALSITFASSIFKPATKNIISQTNSSKNISTSSTTVAACLGCVRRKIDGVYVNPEAANLPPVAIMIDNHPDARPQLGINKANLVYEAEVEGYYTRLMAIFANNQDITAIGPVRSARPYFVDWAQELNAVYGHCGGSPEALVDIEQKNLVDFNEFYNSQYFWRSKDKTAPHNIYTSSENIEKFLAKTNNGQTTYTSWQYKDDLPLNKASTSDSIKINYAGNDFKVSWNYDNENNNYIRYFKDSPELTADDEKILAKNIVIQYIHSIVVDNEGRLNMDDVGSGRATICMDGLCRSGSWSKTNYSSRTIFSYDSGVEVKFNAGTTWIEVMRPQ